MLSPPPSPQKFAFPPINGHQARYSRPLSRRSTVFFLVALLLTVSVFVSLRSSSARLELHELQSHWLYSANSPNPPPPEPEPDSQPDSQPDHDLPDPSEVDWSRFAYTQYVTNLDYLCNSVMLFETLHRLGSRPDRLLMYPSTMSLDDEPPNKETELLRKARDEYNVRLQPIEVVHLSGGDSTWADSYTKLLAFNQTAYARVLNLDSDSRVLQRMDELFLLPAAPVAMPRAYWGTDKGWTELSSQVLLVEPSAAEFARIQARIAAAAAAASVYDMEIVNALYNASALVLPHRPYGLLTGEFRSRDRAHRAYLGNDYEAWDPRAVLAEAKFLHFSDWPVPKPWLRASEAVLRQNQPECVPGEAGADDDCTDRDLWLGFYDDFATRRADVCGMGGGRRGF